MKQTIFNHKLSVFGRWLHLAGRILFLILGGFLPFLVFWAYAKPAESNSLEPTGNEFEHTFLDSNDPGGPVYDWIDISSTGTLVVRPAQMMVMPAPFL